MNSTEKTVANAHRLYDVLVELVERTEIPEPNCYCHISPPCSDCVENRGIRETVEWANDVIKDCQ